jgi:hypothetical protein
MVHKRIKAKPELGPEDRSLIYLALAFALAAALAVVLPSPSHMLF